MSTNYFLIAITILTIICIGLGNFFIKPVQTQKINWWTWNHFINTKWIINILISISFLIYFCCLRWAPGAKDFFSNEMEIINTLNDKYANYISSYEASITFSRTFLLDWCPCFSVLISIVALFDKIQIIVNYLGFLCFFFGLLTIVGGFVGDEAIWWDNLINYVFIGKSLNTIYFALHCYLCVFGFYLFVNTRKTIKIYWIYIIIHTILIGYIIYVNVMIVIFNVKNNASGFSFGDWYSPVYAQYSTVAQVLQLDYRLNALVMCLFMYAIFVVGYLIRYYLQKVYINKYNIKYSQEGSYFAYVKNHR
ncbi:hypothetical protein DSQ43_02355 [Ureaplasma urealyticum]|nr:hypothetical protein DSQ43_02355 [Ureaplasma urealyticum]